MVSIYWFCTIKKTSIAPSYGKNGFTLTRCRSMGFIIVPWKNSTVVKWRLNSPSNSKSGGFLICANLFRHLHLFCISVAFDFVWICLRFFFLDGYFVIDRFFLCANFCLIWMFAERFVCLVSILRVSKDGLGYRFCVAFKHLFGSILWLIRCRAVECV